jgi:hypothetical protein
MPKRTRGIRKHAARVLLSDILPYELPPSFNNRGFYDFVQRTGAKLTQAGPVARQNDAATEAMLSIVFGRPVTFEKGSSPNKAALLGTGPGRAQLPTIPFQFTVRHRANDYRTLTVPHPAAQLDIADFYDKNTDLLLYHTAKSPFSLRHPARVARYTAVRDWTFNRTRRKHPDQVEEDSHEYEWIRSFFTYRRYSNIYKFYDSPHYRECERRFGFLVKVDIAKCFDSIYTHSLAWATDNHDVIKASLWQNKSKKQNQRAPFGEDFDKLMQRLNHNETSGITTGSEVSRIFAEIILQAVDVDLHAALQKKGLTHGVDYEILRYVDDYFIFLADATRRTEVIGLLAEKLRAYKLRLNASKEEGEDTPWLSPLSIAKQRVRHMIRDSIRKGDPEPGSGKLPRPYVPTESLIVGYKEILLNTGVSHFDLANWALLQGERRLEKLIRKSQKHLRADTPHEDAEGHFHTMTGALLALMDFSFFVYSGAPRMSPAVKVARIVSSVLRFSRQTGVAAHDRERVEMRVRQELTQQLRRSARSEEPNVVTATLLDCLTDLGPNYRASEEELAEWFRFPASDAGNGYDVPDQLDALLLFSLILHTRDYGGYRLIRHTYLRWALEIQDRDQADTERALVSLNLLSCPWVDQATKTKILAAYNITSQPRRKRPHFADRGWNIDWTGFDLYSALQSKRLYEVY